MEKPTLRERIENEGKVGALAIVAEEIKEKLSPYYKSLKSQAMCQGPGSKVTFYELREKVSITNPNILRRILHLTETNRALLRVSPSHKFGKIDLFGLVNDDQVKKICEETAYQANKNFIDFFPYTKPSS